MCKREVLIIGDGTTTSTWSYQPSEGLGGAQQIAHFSWAIFKNRVMNLPWE